MNRIGFLQSLANELNDRFEKDMANEIYLIVKRVIEPVFDSQGILQQRIKELERYEIFYKHIQLHLSTDEFVVCKICDKSLEEIEQALKENE